MDIVRGGWLVSLPHAQEYQRLANRFLKGEYTGAQINRLEILAAARSSEMPGRAVEEKRIGVITMRGVIPTHGDLCILGADDYLEIFRAYNDNDKVSAIVVDMDVLGSTVAAIDYFKEFLDEKKKPIVTLAKSAYSGGYWVAAMFSDHIMAYGDISAGFGSIGVMAMMMDDREAMKNEGVKPLIIRAPQSTTKGQDMIDFYEGRDKEFIEARKKEMEPMCQAFINDVIKYRPEIIQDTEGLLTGSEYNAKASLANGLIDSIGNEKQAFALANALAELNEL